MNFCLLSACRRIFSNLDGRRLSKSLLSLLGSTVANCVFSDIHRRSAVTYVLLLYFCISVCFYCIQQCKASLVRNDGKETSLLADSRFMPVGVFSVFIYSSFKFFPFFTLFIGHVQCVGIYFSFIFCSWIVSLVVSVRPVKRRPLTSSSNCIWFCHDAAFVHSSSLLFSSRYKVGRGFDSCVWGSSLLVPALALIIDPLLLIFTP